MTTDSMPAKVRISDELGLVPQCAAGDEQRMTMSRYHGFTCPKCGSHYFGTSRMGKDEQQIGRCHENQYSRNGCTYQWRRDDYAAEAACMYQMTAEEFFADGMKYAEP